VLEAAALYATGGTSLLMQGAASYALRDASTQAFGRSLTGSGFTGNQSPLLNAFSGSFNLAAGISGNNGNSSNILDAAYRHGGLADSMNNLSDAMTRLTIALGQDGIDDSDDGSGGGQSWLEAIAKAMGKALGDMAAKLVNESQSLQSLAGDDSAGGAQKFQATMAKFQAHAQLFSMLSDAFSNAIKSIGQGMQTMASKQ
jgi:hypothetical protein